MRTETSLLWFEEWMLYSSVVWGRVAPQWYLVGHCFNIAESTVWHVEYLTINNKKF
jgi:hypothetical protein